MADHIDVKIKSCGWSTSSGPWVKLDLADRADLDFYESNKGLGFHVFHVAIDNGEESKPEDFTTVGDVVEPVKEVVKKSKKPMKPSQEAYLMVTHPNFEKYLDKIKPNWRNIYDGTDHWLKCHIYVDSKKELDLLLDSDVLMRRFREIQQDYASKGPY